MIRSVLPVRDIDGTLKLQILLNHGDVEYHPITRHAACVWLETIATWLRETEEDAAGRA